MKDTQNTEAQEEACAGTGGRGCRGRRADPARKTWKACATNMLCPDCAEKRDADDARRAAAEMDNFKKPA